MPVYAPPGGEPMMLAPTGYAQPAQPVPAYPSHQQQAVVMGQPAAYPPAGMPGALPAAPQQATVGPYGWNTPWGKQGKQV